MAVGAEHDAILAPAIGKTQTQEARTSIHAIANAVTGVFFTLSAIALVAAAVVQTIGVINGHVMGKALLWQDEVTI
jgi:C4-dicarboxylate transporter, DctM subunit